MLREELEVKCVVGVALRVEVEDLEVGQAAHVELELGHLFIDLLCGHAPLWRGIAVKYSAKHLNIS